MLVRAVIKALRASATDEMPGGGDDEVVTRGRVGAADVTPTEDTPVVGGTGAEGSPDVAIGSDTKLVRLLALLRRL